MGLLLPLIIVVHLALVCVLSIDPCPCTELTPFKDNSGNFKASCSCSMCLDKDYALTTDVAYFVEAPLTIHDKELKNHGSNVADINGIFVFGGGPGGVCDPIGDDIKFQYDPFARNQGTVPRGKWIRHMAVDFDMGGGPIAKLGGAEGTSIYWGDRRSPRLPAIGAIEHGTRQEQSMLDWLQMPNDPCLHAQSRGSRFAVCTYCFCISFLLQI